MTEAEIKKRLNKFSKGQIIDGIVKTQSYRGHVERLISNIEYLENDKLIKKHLDAIEATSKATKQYCSWCDEVIQKYGSDGKVKLADIPNEELIKGADVESKMMEAREKERRLEKKVNAVLEI